MVNQDSKSNTVILDCTLRDGGYYNRWDFEPKLVAEYLQAMASSGIGYVELGLRNFAQPVFCGPFAYTTESFVNDLELPPGPVYGVMVDAKTVLEAGMPVTDVLDKLFVPKKDSKIGLVRVAAHFKEIAECGVIVQRLKELGYTVGLNMMQAGGKVSVLITELSAEVQRWNCVDVLYFADSLGNMDATEVARIVAAIRQGWDGEIGIHTHNNMGQAISNSMTAMQAGVTWLDSTVTGMGRGAGNAQTEYLLALLEKSTSRYTKDPVCELVIRYFQSMKSQYGWGEGLLYFLGAQNNVHPTYIQNLLSNTHYGKDEIIGAIKYLSNLEDSNSFSNTIMEGALNFGRPDKDVSGSECLVNRFAGREVLMIGKGESVARYQRDIERYIRQQRPVVISVNISEHISEELIDYFCITHNTKFLADSQKYKGLGKPVILPEHRFTDEELLLLSDVPERLSFGLKVVPATLEVHDEYCVLPYGLTLGYAMCAASVARAASIRLVGVDGYEKGDHRQLEMIELIESFKDKVGLGISALTPTSYPVTQGSIYAPAL